MLDQSNQQSATTLAKAKRLGFRIQVFDRDNQATLTITAEPLLSVVRMTDQIVEPAVSLSQPFQQHMTCLRIDGHQTTRVGTHVVLGDTCQIPVFQLSSEVSFLDATAESDGSLLLQCIAADGPEYCC